MHPIDLKAFHDGCLAPPSSVSDATNQPGLVTASRVAGVFSAPAEKAGAYTSKRTGSSDDKFSTSALRRGSGASELESSFVGKRVSISIVLDLQGFRWEARDHPVRLRSEGS